MEYFMYYSQMLMNAYLANMDYYTTVVIPVLTRF